MHAIHIENLTKLFDESGKKVPALEDIHLDVEEGEFLMVMGPPGSGKSTLLSVLGGLTLQDKGDYTLFGENLSKMRAKERAQFRMQNIGLVFQNLHLMPELTAYDNVLIPLILSGVPKKPAKQEVDELFYQFGIEEKKGRFPRELSQGDNQLIAIARALSVRPRLLLLNEPTLFLDHPSAVKIMTVLREMVIDHRLTIIAVISDIRLHPFAHRIMRMREGRIISIVGEALMHMEEPPFLKI